MIYFVIFGFILLYLKREKNDIVAFSTIHNICNKMKL